MIPLIIFVFGEFSSPEGYVLQPTRRQAPASSSRGVPLERKPGRFDTHNLIGLVNNKCGLFMLSGTQHLTELNPLDLFPGSLQASCGVFVADTKNRLQKPGRQEHSLH